MATASVDVIVERLMSKWEHSGLVRRSFPQCHVVIDLVLRFTNVKTHRDSFLHVVRSLMPLLESIPSREYDTLNDLQLQDVTVGRTMAPYSSLFEVQWDRTMRRSLTTEYKEAMRIIVWLIHTESVLLDDGQTPFKAIDMAMSWDEVVEIFDLSQRSLPWSIDFSSVVPWFASLAPRSRQVYPAEEEMDMDSLDSSSYSADEMDTSQLEQGAVTTVIDQGSADNLPILSNEDIDANLPVAAPADVAQCECDRKFLNKTCRIQFTIITSLFCTECAPASWTPQHDKYYCVVQRNDPTRTYKQNLELVIYSQVKNDGTVQRIQQRVVYHNYWSVFKYSSGYFKQHTELCVDGVKMGPEVVERMNSRSGYLGAFIGSHFDQSRLIQANSLGLLSRIKACGSCSLLVSLCLQRHPDEKGWSSWSVVGREFEVLSRLFFSSTVEKSLFELTATVLSQVVDCCTGTVSVPNVYSHSHDESVVAQELSYVHHFTQMYNTLDAKCDRRIDSMFVTISYNQSIDTTSPPLVYMQDAKASLGPHFVRAFHAIEKNYEGKSKYDLQAVVWDAVDSNRLVGTCYSCLTPSPNHSTLCLKNTERPELFLNLYKIPYEQRLASLAKSVVNDATTEQQLASVGFFSTGSHLKCTYCDMTVEMLSDRAYNEAVLAVHRNMDACPAERYRNVTDCHLCGTVIGCKSCLTCHHTLCLDCLSRCENVVCPFCRASYNLAATDSCPEVDQVAWSQKVCRGLSEGKGPTEFEMRGRTVKLSLRDGEPHYDIAPTMMYAQL